MAPSPPDALFAKAVEHYRGGNTAEAESGCRRTLELDPRHFAANYLLGLIALQQGAFEAAARSIGHAISINPNVAPAHRHHGAALAQSRQFEEAVDSFGRAVALKPDDAEAFALRANALQELGQFEKALADYDRSLALKPDYAAAHNNRGLALHRLGRPDQALESIDRAIAFSPNYAAAHKNRADVLGELERHTDALASYDRAIRLNPNMLDAFYGRGAALHELARPLEAIASYDRAIALDPRFAPALNDRGNVLKELERFDAALESYDAALAAAPDLAEAWYNRGIVLLELKRASDALASYERAIAVRPDYPEALLARGVCKLALGRFDDCWRDVESRWRVKAHPALRAPTDAPLWSGEDLCDRSILVCSERGLGDIIQFSRYVPSLAARGARVRFLVPEKMQRVLGELAPTVRLISLVVGSDRFDYHCALMSLPDLLGLASPDSPLPIPYLASDAERAARWKMQIGERGFKIGIAWQGAPWQGGAPVAGRAIPLAAFKPLAEIDSVRLISLQKEHGVEQLGNLPAGMAVETLGDEFDAGPDAFVDTIAVMESLDLIVTCDTSIAHVAGARGRPVWVALQHVPEWRWMLEGETSPWYPTARVFRQKARGDWSGVFANMASELRGLLAAQ